MEKNFSESLTLKESSISDGVITGICILKPISKNNRVYTEQALQSLTTLAHKAKAFLDHAQDASVKNLFGVFENIENRADGVYGNLNLLKESEMYKKFLEIVERFPNSIGFSISARGKFSEYLDTDGREVVEDILVLRSIDLVGTPATTNGIFEQLEDAEKTPEELKVLEQELIEAIKNKGRVKNIWYF